MNEPLDRVELLHQLVELNGDLRVILVRLRSAVPPRSGELVQLNRTNVRNALDEFLVGRLTADQLEQWAEAVHSRDDVLLDPSDEPFLARALFELSTPELFGSMNQVVRELHE